MNNLQEDYNNLIKTEMYKEFIEANPEYFLTHIFIVKDKNITDKQIGFYSKKTDKIVSFDIQNHKLSEPQEVMKKEGYIEKLELNKINIDFNQAIKTVNNTIQKKYSAHKITKYISILQSIKQPIWNITAVTDTLNILNVKIDAIQGNIISENFQPIMSLAKK